MTEEVTAEQQKEEAQKTTEEITKEAKQKSRQESAWGTHNEIGFIRKLGQFSAIGKTTPRKDLLLGYLAGCQQRKQWDKIDPKKVFKAVDKALAKFKS